MLEKLTALRDALAADGVLRHLVTFVHPDTIIAFADGVAEAVEAAAEEQPKEAAKDRARGGGTQARGGAPQADRAR